MKTRKKVNVISGELDVKVPTAWERLNQKELAYIYFLLAKGVDKGMVKSLFFIRKAGMNPVKEVQPGIWFCQCGRSTCYVRVMDLAVGVQTLDWMDADPKVPIRLEEIHKAKAVNNVLHGVAFGDWLSMDNLFQGFIASKNPEALRDMAKYLYPGIDLKSLRDIDLYNISQWYTQIKIFFAKKWPDLFSGSGDGGKFSPEDSMNAMIRSLTGGDVLKENDVCRTVDVWRALTELNQKAREAADFKSKMS